MNAVVPLIVAAAGSAALFWLLPPALLLRPGRRFPALVPVTVAPIAGAVLIVLELGHLQVVIERRNWPSVDGVVVKSEVVGERAPHPLIVFEYTLDGVKHVGNTDLHAPGFGLRTSREEVAYAIVNALPVGAEVKVFYNSSDSTEALLKPGPTWDLLVRLSLGLMLYFIGIYALLTVLLLAGKDTDGTTPDNTESKSETETA
ncbi:MAG: DUF3592 domain-containing protein [Lentisphaeria bacterium]|nr:DUF3592 domain-containing protein [Lentisphaeria bacterium]